MGKKRRNLRAKGEDRISSLPDDLIHHILSTTDANDVIQTSLLSTRWRHIWKSLPHLNFNRCHFSRLLDFSKFVSQFITHRNHSGISVISLKCDYGLIDPPLIKKISTYAISHNARELNIFCDVSRRGSYRIQLSTFSSRSLHHLYLNSIYLKASNLPKSTWNLPALTTLILQDVSFEFCCNSHGSKSADLFSNLLNLKNLTLNDCSTNGLEVIYIISPQLETLVIESRYCRYLCKFVVSAPKLLSFEYSGDYGLLISTNDLNYLDKIYINIGGIFGYHNIVGDYEKKQKIRQEVIHMFHQLRGARFVLLTLYTIEVISWALDLVNNKPSPFSKMECLKIVRCYYWNEESKFPISVITYLSNSSPKSSIVNECKEYFQDS